MIHKLFPADVDALPEALALVESEMESLDCSMKTVMQVSVCVEEIFVNVANYAYPEERGDLTLDLDVQDGMLVITITDSGIAFDPLAKDDPDITLSAEERKIGGLGIFMVKKAMDEISYKRENGKNIFTMKKEI